MEDLDKKNVDIIKGLLKYIKASGITWNEQLDIIFSPNFNESEYNPKPLDDDNVSCGCCGEC
jgi:hypothetical protein